MYYKKIIFDKPGQTCNRFWSYLDTVSWAVLNRKHIAILFWDDSLVDYDNLRKSRFVSFPFYKSFLFRTFGTQRWKRFVERFLSRRKISHFFSGRIGRALGFIEGWPIREADKYFPQIANEVRPLFIPNKEISYAVEKNMSCLRNSSDLVVGVHIRRGDYAGWKNGAFFYDYPIYARWMEQIISLNPEKRVCFYVSSNEPIPQWMFERFNISHIDGKAAHDLYSLQLCDYLIGPPSTFSKWASIIGHVPYLIAYDKDMHIESMDMFSPLKSHTVFETGRVVW